MKKAPGKNAKTVMQSEYDFSSGVRGLFAERYAAGTNLVRLDADVAAVFPDSESVNQALRTLVGKAGRQPKQDDTAGGPADNSPAQSVRPRPKARE